jgi:hypothetical protein
MALAFMNVQATLRHSAGMQTHRIFGSSGLGVVRSGAFGSALSEPVIEFAHEPGNAGPGHPDAPRETPARFPSQQGRVAHVDPNALQISARGEGLLSVQNVHLSFLQQVEVVKERSDKRKDGTGRETLRAMVLKAPARSDLRFSHVFEDELDGAIKLLMVTRDFQEDTPDKLRQGANHLLEFRVPVSARERKVGVKVMEVVNAAKDN